MLAFRHQDFGMIESLGVDFWICLLGMCSFVSLSSLDSGEHDACVLLAFSAGVFTENVYWCWELSNLGELAEGMFKMFFVIQSNGDEVIEESEIRAVFQLQSWR